MVPRWNHTRQGIMGTLMAPRDIEGAILGIREQSAFHVRMPEELKQQLEKESKINGRSLNAEIVNRLKTSLEKQASGHRVSEPGGTGYQLPELTDAERQLLGIFRNMPPTKQLALISLFK